MADQVAIAHAPDLAPALFCNVASRRDDGSIGLDVINGAYECVFRDGFLTIKGMTPMPAAIVWQGSCRMHYNEALPWIQGEIAAGRSGL